MIDATLGSWAMKEFGHAQLGDARRVQRLVAMAAAVAARPAGRLTQVFTNAADREAGFRFVESSQFSHHEIIAATRTAAARRAAAFPIVYVVTDGAALAPHNRTGVGFAALGERNKPYISVGTQAMSALVLCPDGVPLGLAAQHLWTRGPRPSTPRGHDLRPVQARATGYWLAAMADATAALQTHAPATLPWFQMDRGADCAAVFAQGLALGVGFTVRACYNRRLTGGGTLWSTVGAAPCYGTYILHLPARAGRAARRACVELRACEVTLALRDACTNTLQPTQLTVVQAKEINYDGADGIVWRLLTNRTVTTVATAHTVITGYCRRWAVEEFHLAWKSGSCRIEDSYLRAHAHFAKWATLLAAVAIRAERIRKLSRAEPDLPASVEFSPDEIRAVILLRQPVGVRHDACPTLGEVVRWIADTGGYTGKSSGGPPGVRIIARAMIRVEAVAAALAAMRDPSGTCG